MSSPSPIRSALLLVDNQIGFTHPTHWGHSRSNPSFERNIAMLLSAFRARQLVVGESIPSIAPLIIHVYHSSLDPNSPLHPLAGNGIEFLPFARPQRDEIVVEKHENSAFIGTDLESTLRQQRISQLFIAGLTTVHCVSTTTRMAANLKVTALDGKPGRVVLVPDATATFSRGSWDAETVHAVEVEILRDEFAEIMSTADVVDLVGHDRT